MKQKLLDEVIPPADGELAPPKFLEPTSECQMIYCSPHTHTQHCLEWWEKRESMLWVE